MKILYNNECANSDYYLRINKDDDYVFLCDSDRLRLTMSKNEYHIKIHSDGLRFGKGIQINVVELLDCNKKVVGFRSLTFPILMVPGDRLCLEWGLSVFTDGETTTING